MRTIQEIESELKQTQLKTKQLNQELNDVKFQTFLKNNVPAGDKPIFENRKGERVLATHNDGSWAMGCLIRKDGTVSGVLRRLWLEDYKFVGE